MNKDILEIAPESTKVIFENERVRVVDLLLKPGEKADTHSHPDFFAYILNDSKIKNTPNEGEASEREFKEGEVMWSEATTHITENTGTTDTHVLIVELK